MKSVAEILIGKKAEDWKTTDLWIIRLFISAVGLAGWLVMWFLVTLMKSAPHLFLMHISTAFVVGFFYFIILVVSSLVLIPKTLIKK